MKVKELIEELKKLDQDSTIQVGAYDYEGSLFTFTPDKIVTPDTGMYSFEEYRDLQDAKQQYKTDTLYLIQGCCI